MKKNSFVLFGEIINTRGLKGELKVKVYNPLSPLLRPGTILYCNTKKYTIQKITQHKDFFYIFFDTVYSIDEAEKLKGQSIFILRGDILLQEEEHILADLIDFTVMDKDMPIGIVEHIINLGAGDILVIRQNNKHECLIPYNKEFIVKVDAEQKIIYAKDTEDFTL